MTPRVITPGSPRVLKIRENWIGLQDAISGLFRAAAEPPRIAGLGTTAPRIRAAGPPHGPRPDGRRRGRGRIWL